MNEVNTMSGNDYIKYFTEQMVMYMNHPESYRQARKARKTEKQEQRQEQKTNIYTNRWLGVVPFAVKLFLKEKQQAR